MNYLIAYYIVGCVIAYFNTWAFMRRLDAWYPTTAPTERLGVADWIFGVFVAGAIWPIVLVVEQFQTTPQGWRKRR